VSDNLSTQFPNPPELQPLAAPPAKGQQIFSSLLIVAGLLLLATGGWMFIQYEIEINKPPPARIIEVSVTDLTQTPTPRPTSTPSPTLTVTSTPARKLGDTLFIEPTKIRYVTPTPKNTATPENTPRPKFTPTSTPEVIPTAAPIGEAAPSMEDNPLVVEEPEAPGPAVAEESIPSPITRIVVESISLDAPVIGVGWITQVISSVPTNIWSVADYAAGWHSNSALPGQGGNIVLSGHHNIKGEVFRYTIDMNVGDIVTLYLGDQAFKYAVVDKFIVKDKGQPDAVRRENAKWIGPFDEERLTLVTCWPYTNNTHRAIVIAKPVQP
jgi:LPXTG-site transpeptidase (sortase) family protein